MFSWGLLKRRGLNPFFGFEFLWPGSAQAGIAFGAHAL
jgi:hypothetical protein